MIVQRRFFLILILAFFLFSPAAVKAEGKGNVWSSKAQKVLEQLINSQGNIQLPVNKGGTGVISWTNGQLLIGNTTGNTAALSTLTGTANQVSVTNGAGSITLAAPQDIATSSTPQFARLGLGQAAHATNVFSLLSTDTTASGKAMNVSHTGVITGTGYGGYFSKTGASTTNVGIYATASGATNNYAAVFDAGRVGVGITTPGVQLDVKQSAAGAEISFRVLNSVSSPRVELGTIGGSEYGVINIKDNSSIITTQIPGNGNAYFNGGYAGFGTNSPSEFVHLAETPTISGAVADGYAAALRIAPGYTSATPQTVTRHNYIDLQNVTVAGAGPAAVTNAAAFHFDAAVGTHLALASNGIVATVMTSLGPTGAQTTIQGWLKINVNGTLRYIPFW